MYIVALVTILLILVIIVVIIEQMFLSYEDFCQLVDNDVWFKSLNMHDLYHRSCMTHAQYIDQYKNAYIQLNIWEKLYIYTQCLMLNLPNKLRINYCIIRLRFDPLIEMSFPHTISNCIMLNDIYFNDDYDQQCNTLIHELIHIYQRMYPYDIERLINQMGFYKITHDHQLLINRLNLPIANSSDMSNVYYCVNNGTSYILHMIYKNKQLYDICIDTNGTISQIDFKSDLSQQGHPYEITAEVISRILTNTYVVRPDWISLVTSWLNSQIIG